MINKNICIPPHPNLSDAGDNGQLILLFCRQANGFSDLLNNFTSYYSMKFLSSLYLALLPSKTSLSVETVVYISSPTPLPPNPNPHPTTLIITFTLTFRHFHIETDGQQAQL